MQLCLMIEGQEGVSWEQWVALAQACERHGIPALFRSDHYMNLDGGHPERGSLDAWGTLCALAAVTIDAAARDDGLAGDVPASVRAGEAGRRPPTTSPAGGWSSGSEPAGTSASTRRYGFPVRRHSASAIDVLEEQLQIVLGELGTRGRSRSTVSTTRCEASTRSRSRSRSRTRR